MSKFSLTEIRTFLMLVAKEYGSETIQEIFEWFLQIGGVSDAEDYRKGIKERTAMTREWSLFLEKYPLEILNNSISGRE